MIYIYTIYDMIYIYHIYIPMSFLKNLLQILEQLCPMAILFFTILSCQYGRFTFDGINHSLRNDDEYMRRLDEDHHKESKSPLSLIPIDMVSQVPFEYMHLVCLGVMKKILIA